MKKYLYICCIFLLTSLYTKAQEKTTAHKSNYISIFDQLQDEELFRIDFTSSGCFHGVKEIMVIKKSKDIYYVIFKDHIKMLTTHHIEAIGKFEKGLTRARDYGCTTVDTYLITHNGKQQMITDGSCRWNGYYDLKKALGFNEK